MSLHTEPPKVGLVEKFVLVGGAVCANPTQREHSLITLEIILTYVLLLLYVEELRNFFVYNNYAYDYY